MWKLALSCSLCPASVCPCFPLQAVVVCIRNNEFEKASDIVKKHMGKEPRSQVSPCWDEVRAAAMSSGGLVCPGGCWGEEAKTETILLECWSLVLHGWVVTLEPPVSLTFPPTPS